MSALRTLALVGHDGEGPREPSPPREPQIVDAALGRLVRQVDTETCNLDMRDRYVVFAQLRNRLNKSMDEMVHSPGAELV